MKTSKTILVLVMLVFTGITVFFVRHDYELWRDLPGFQEVTGKVESKRIEDVAYRSAGKTRHRKRHHVSVTFTPKDAATPITKDETITTRIYDMVTVGQPVQVFHDPSDPQRLVLVERSVGPWWSVALVPLLFFVLPLIVIALILARKRPVPPGISA